MCMWQFFPFLVCEWLHIKVWKTPSIYGEYKTICFGGYPLSPSNLHQLLFHIDPVIVHLQRRVDRMTLSCMSILIHDQDYGTSVLSDCCPGSNNWLLLHNVVINTFDVVKMSWRMWQSSPTMPPLAPRSTSNPDFADCCNAET